MRAFKHVHRDHAVAFANGTSIRVATHSYYRNLESDRGDREEGLTKFVQQAEHHPMPNDWLDHPEVAEAMFGGPAILDISSVFSGNTFQFVLSPMYIFCASAEPDLTRVEAIFEISSIELLAGRLHKAMRRYLGDPQWGVVTYEQRSGVMFRDRMRKPSPFIKHPDFEWEQEIRAAWPTADGSPDVLDIFAPRIASLFKRIK